MQLPASTTSGIYMILNWVNGKRYIGSAAVSIRRRAKAHRNELNGNRHPNTHLQRAWNKYGADAFIFMVLEECQPDKCTEYEQDWIDQYDSINTGYNLCPTAGSRIGCKMSAETKEKIAATKRGKKLSAETRAKMSVSQKGKVFTAETRAKLVATHWSRSPQAREVVGRIVASRTGKVPLTGE